MQRRLIVLTALAIFALTPANAAVRGKGQGRGMTPSELLLPIGPTTVVDLSNFENFVRRLPKNFSNETLKTMEAIHYRDPLTGLPNRAALMELIAPYYDNPHLQHGNLALGIIDMNRFGPINSGLSQVHGELAGYEKADQFIARSGATLKRIADEFGVQIARLGGEEFVVVGPAGSNVLAALEEVHRTFTPGRLLHEAGLTPVEKEAIEAQLKGMKVDMARDGGHVGDFTSSLIMLNGRTFQDGLTDANRILTSGKSQGLRGNIFIEGKGQKHVIHDIPYHVIGPKVIEQTHDNRFLEELKELRQRISPKIYQRFLDLVFHDPLTHTRKREYLPEAMNQWLESYKSGEAQVVVLNQRNLKEVNEHHPELYKGGDHLLKMVGEIIMQEVRSARGRGADIQDPIRFASKVFILVGVDAIAIADAIQTEVALRIPKDKYLEYRNILRKAIAGYEISPYYSATFATLRKTSARLVTDPYEALVSALEAMKGLKNLEDKK
jgi:GGDEF domain-containing protein